MRDPRHNHGFTRIELLVIGLIIGGFLVSMVAPDFIGCRNKSRAHRAVCINNLKQIGLGLRMWANDHQENFPWQVSTNEGGTLEYADSLEVWRHFQTASNELMTPKILTCPTDIDRVRTANWTPLSNTNLTYFLSLTLTRQCRQGCWRAIVSSAPIPRSSQGCWSLQIGNCCVLFPVVQGTLEMAPAATDPLPNSQRPACAKRFQIERSAWPFRDGF
jgi:hypothetical protein